MCIQRWGQRRGITKKTKKTHTQKWLEWPLTSPELTVSSDLEALVQISHLLSSSFAIHFHTELQLSEMLHQQLLQTTKKGGEVISLQKWDKKNINIYKKQTRGNSFQNTYFTYKYICYLLSSKLESKKKKKKRLSWTCTTLSRT